jgi:hypothetical protein
MFTGIPGILFSPDERNFFLIETDLRELTEQGLAKILGQDSGAAGKKIDIFRFPHGVFFFSSVFLRTACRLTPHQTHPGFRC